MSYAKAVARQTFSTKSFVPGHVLGTAVLLFGTIALAKAIIALHKDEVRGDLTADLASAPTPVWSPASPARIENPRGHYGKRP